MDHDPDPSLFIEKVDGWTQEPHVEYFCMWFTQYHHLRVLPSLPAVIEDIRLKAVIAGSIFICLNVYWSNGNLYEFSNMRSCECSPLLSHSWCTSAMESLLSLSFDYLSSSDAGKLRKGLKQLEGLLAQLCLCCKQHTSTPNIQPRAQVQAPKDLINLRDDPAFREFFKLQEGFEWNGMQVSFIE